MEVINIPDIMQNGLEDVHKDHPLAITTQRLLDAAQNENDGWPSGMDQVNEYGVPIESQKPDSAWFTSADGGSECPEEEVQVGMKMGAYCQEKGFNIYVLYIDALETVMHIPALGVEAAAFIVNRMIEQITK